ncbi:MAG TPA: phosphopentomutase [Polyangia bacterium]|nr:phosphopentomutase [Polyangia bacterium]
MASARRALRRALILVADSLGCGEAPDAAAYGDQGTNTLGNLARQLGGLELPHLAALGLGNLTEVEGVPPRQDTRGAYGKMREASAGKDTTTGHWEMAGLIIEQPFATFPHGFPREMIEEFVHAVGRGMLGNRPASGTVILDELGETHVRTGELIVYTSADSVFQIAAHENVVPLAELYRICERARQICDRYRIGRVIARPFVGQPGAWRRTYNRRDFAMPPPEPTILDAIRAAGLPSVGVGKIGDIFSMQGLDENLHSEGNADGLDKTLGLMERVGEGLIFVNLVDFDMLYGHRNDAPGYARCLAEFDAFLPALDARLRPGDLVIITADHGNDPTTPSTDHSREYVPLLAYGPPAAPGRDLGVRAQFCDVAQTLAEGFSLPPRPFGDSFLGELL